jgi:S1-C subfamily serine protease
LRPVVEYLQKLVAIGALVEENSAAVKEAPGTFGRMYRAPAGRDIREMLIPAPGKALGIAYVAHVFGDIVVRVHRSNSEGESIGSGVVVSRNLVLTNRHVVEGGGKVSVSWGDSEPVPAVEVRVPKDSKMDIALVEAPRFEPFPHAWTRAPVATEEVVALGYPHVPQAMSRPLLRFPGWVSSDGLVPTIFGDEVSVVSAVFTPGASGGGVFARDGCLVGLISQSLESQELSNDGKPRFSIFHAMIPADRVLTTLKGMHKKCWLLNEFGNEEDVRRREEEGWTEEYETIPC